MLKKLLPNIYKYKNLIEGKNVLIHFEYKRNYEANITKRSIRKLLHFFYKQVHPDLTSTLPEELKKKEFRIFEYFKFIYRYIKYS